MSKDGCEVVERKGEGVKVRFMPADNVLRKVEKLGEKGMGFHWRYKELESIVNVLQESGQEVIEVVDSDRGRDTWTGKPFHIVEIRLGEGGKHLKDEEIEYIIDWALSEYGKREVDKRIGYLPM